MGRDAFQSWLWFEFKICPHMYIHYCARESSRWPGVWAWLESTTCMYIPRGCGLNSKSAHTCIYITVHVRVLDGLVCGHGWRVLHVCTFHAVVV